MNPISVTVPQPRQSFILETNIQNQNQNKDQITDASHPDFQRKSTLLHSLKTKISHIEPSIIATDPQFDNAKANYNKFCESLLRLKISIQQFQTHARGLLTNSTTVSAELALGLDKPQNEKHSHYQHFVDDLHNKHLSMNEFIVGSISERIDEECSAAIDTQQTNFVHLNKRIEERAMLRRDVEYYSTKLAKLEERKDKKATEQLITEKEHEKIARNAQKLALCTEKYNSFNQLLTQDLESVFSRKEQILGPIAESFALIEREIVESYGNATMEKHHVEKTRYERRLRDLPAPTSESTTQTKEHVNTSTDIPIGIPGSVAANANANPNIPVSLRTSDNVSSASRSSASTSDTSRTSTSSNFSTPMAARNNASFSETVVPTVFEQVGYRPATPEEQPIQRAGYESDLKIHTMNANNAEISSLPLSSEEKQHKNPFDESFTDDDTKDLESGLKINNDQRQTFNTRNAMSGLQVTPTNASLSLGGGFPAKATELKSPETRQQSILP